MSDDKFLSLFFLCFEILIVGLTLIKLKGILNNIKDYTKNKLCIMKEAYDESKCYS